MHGHPVCSQILTLPSEFRAHTHHIGVHGIYPETVHFGGSLQRRASNLEILQGVRVARHQLRERVDNRHRPRIVLAQFLQLKKT